MSQEELVKLFEEKIKKEKTIPTARDIDQDQNFPSYRTFKKSFGDKKIREVEALSEIIDYYKIVFKINELFCHDCKLDSSTCGQQLQDCKKQGKLYIKFLKKELEDY